VCDNRQPLLSTYFLDSENLDIREMANRDIDKIIERRKESNKYS
jgi:hypothetical protein